MKTITDQRSALGNPAAGKVRVLWRYLDRLAGAWEYASDKDLVILEAMLDDLEPELDRVDENLPDGDTFMTAARRCVERAHTSRADLRMRHLESAGESVKALLTHFESRR
jgi:hypothetical protein